MHRPSNFATGGRCASKAAGEAAAVVVAVVVLPAVVLAFLILLVAVAALSITVFFVDSAGAAVRWCAVRVRGLFPRPGRYGGRSEPENGVEGR